jgi:phenylacetate-CoA ligase
VATGDPQLERLNALLRVAATDNTFHAPRLSGVQLAGWDDLRTLPLMTRDELRADQAQHPPFGTNHSYSLERYTQMHLTRGASGKRICVLETQEDAQRWTDRGRAVLAAAGVRASDRVSIVARGLGTRMASWSALEGAKALGALVVPLEGTDPLERIGAIRDYATTIVLCRPGDALQLAEVAEQQDLVGALDSVRALVCTGEPGASVPALRERIEAGWQARCFDYATLAEVGAFAIPCHEHGGMHLVEDDFVFEFLEPHSSEPLTGPGPAELVITGLARVGFPVIRYRTGDIVEVSQAPCPSGHPGSWLPAGILGRVDDTVVIRGRTVFPFAIEQALRACSEVVSFRIMLESDRAARDDVKVEAELADPLEGRSLAAALSERLGLRVRIVPLRPGTLTQVSDPSGAQIPRPSRPEVAEL